MVATTGFAAYQLRYDVDARSYEVRVYELRSGADGSATFRTWIPAEGTVSFVYTAGVYRVTFPATRPAAARVARCVSARPSVAYASRTDAISGNG